MTSATTENAIEARNIVKRFDGEAAVDGIDLIIRKGSIFGILGPNGAGKTTMLRMLLGIIDPDEGERFLLGSPDPISKSHQVGYLPEERGLYQSMKAYDAIAFMGGRERGRQMMQDHGLGDATDKQIRALSKGMAQTVQLLGTLVHEPDLIILDEPFSGLDALNQGKLERLIRRQADKGVTVIFSTHVIAHAERLCEEIAIVANGKIPFMGKVSVARDRLRPQVHLETKTLDGPWRSAIPADCKPLGHNWHFTLPESGVEPLLRALIEGNAGIQSLSIERPGLHDAFVAIAGEAEAKKMEEDKQEQAA